MKWFKCLSPDHPLMIPIIKEFGFEGYGMACAVLSECYFQELPEIDEIHLKKWLGIYPKRAKKMAEHFKRLVKDWANFTQTFQKIDQTFEKIDQTLPKLSKRLVNVEALNPRGSIKEEENREKRREENILASCDATTQIPLELPNQEPTPKKKATRLTDDWKPSDSLLEWAKKHPNVDVKLQTERFKNHHIAKGNVMLDWNRAWQNWMSSPYSQQTPQQATQIVPNSERVGGRIKL